MQDGITTTEFEVVACLNLYPDTDFLQHLSRTCGRLFMKRLSRRMATMQYYIRCLPLWGEVVPYR